MKRVITLMLALAMVFGAVANSSAADIKAKGQWRIGYDWTDNLNFSDADSTTGDNRSEDDFVAQQRFRTQIDVVANENLSGVVFFEMDQTWGLNDANSLGTKAGNNSGGGLGADGVNIETKRAYLDWTVPNTALSVRMGIQGLALPGAVAGSPILDNDVAATVATYKFNDMVSLTGFWARPYDTTIGADANGAGANDELDMFGLVAGIKLDGMEFNPYAVYAAVGADTTAVSGLQTLWGQNKSTGTKYGIYAYNGSASSNVATAMDWVYNGTDNMENSNAYWLGLGSTINLFDPIIFKFDAVYGSVNGGEENLRTLRGNSTAYNGSAVLRSFTDDEINDRAGWMVDAKLSYKMDMVTPGIIAWYASGEDDDIMNGSERLPVVSGAYSPTTFGFDGYTSFNNQTGDLLSNNYSNDGKWAVGLLLEDIKVIDKLTSQFRVLYIEGTNDADVLNSLVTHTGTSKATFLAANVGTFMTDEDHAWEVNFDHKYDIYENLAMVVEMGYVNLDLDDSAWGITNTSRHYDEDAYKLGIVFQYSF